MVIDNQHITTEGKYIGERVFNRQTVKLYLWEDTFFEVWYFYDDNEVKKIEKLDDEKVIDIYIQSMYQKGVPEVCWHDKEEQLRDVGKKVKLLLEKDNPEFLNKLLWDERLAWFCQVIEVKAAYMVDKIIVKGMSFIKAREIAISKLLENPMNIMKAPYVLTICDGIILFPDWFKNRKSEQGFLIENKWICGDGIQSVLSRLDEYGGWEEEKVKEYWNKTNLINKSKEAN